MNSHGKRFSAPSYELIEPKEHSSLLYKEHGFPDPIVCWHYHREYELHLITHSSGKLFVGDYIGNFYPGNLVLTGPNLPHNWISHTENGEVYPQRDKIVVFTEEMIQAAGQALPEFTELKELLHRASFGIEFKSPQTVAEAQRLMAAIAQSDGLECLAHFLNLMSQLAKTDQYQLLSSEHYLAIAGERNQQRTNQAVNYIFNHYVEDLSLEEVAQELGMQPTYFSKFFRQTTGRRFIEFVNCLRITRASDLLAHSDMPITNICFEVGFSNISNFNRHFMSVKNTTPSEYRKLSGLTRASA